MKFIDFVKIKASEDSPIGDLAGDILSDLDFPINESEESMFEYVKFKLGMNGLDDVYELMLKEFNKSLTNDVQAGEDSLLNFIAQVPKAQLWSYYKENFSVDKVYLIGEPNDFYKAYCVSDKSGKALFIDLKSMENLNSVGFVDESSIHIGELTNIVTKELAIQSLKNCVYKSDSGLNKIRYDELISFLGND